jgi:hypothetical protein
VTRRPELPYPGDLFRGEDVHAALWSTLDPEPGGGYTAHLLTTAHGTTWVLDLVADLDTDRWQVADRHPFETFEAAAADYAERSGDDIPAPFTPETDR